MTPTIQRIALITFVSVSIAMLGFAQTQGKTTARVNLRSGPSKDSSRVALVEKGSTVTLLQKQADHGFYHVRTVQNQEGWLLAQYVSLKFPAHRAVVRKPTNFEVEPHRIGMAAAACAPDLASCPANGCAAAGSAHALVNQLKQTTPSGSTPMMLSFDDFANLQQQADNSVGEDKELTAGDRAQLKGLTVAAGQVSEGDLVSVVGYLVGTPHPNTGESVNCNLKGESNNDYHIPMSNDPSNSDFQGIVVEMIPQGRGQNWNLANLTQVESAGQLVMVTGALFYDNMHKVNGDANNPVRGQPARFSLFEVHPLTQFVVCTKADNSCDPAQSGDWAPLGGA
jgi:hypothetical protein